MHAELLWLTLADAGPSSSALPCSKHLVYDKSVSQCLSSRQCICIARYVKKALQDVAKQGYASVFVCLLCCVYALHKPMRTTARQLCYLALQCLLDSVHAGTLCLL